MGVPLEAADGRRRLLLSLLGDLPDRSQTPSARSLGFEERDGFTVERLELDLNGLEAVPALLLVPKAGKGPFPTVVYHHAHGGNWHLGKDELLAGAPPFLPVPWARDLTDRGWAVLSIDHWAFGGRSGRSQDDLFKEMLWNGRVLWGMMVFDALRAVDFLVTRPEVDPARIATLGFSMGSTIAWWSAALDERIRVCVDLCCLTDFHALIDSGGLGGHGPYYYVPSLLRHFSTSDVNALIAPRAHLALAGTLDRLTPIAGLRRIDANLKELYLRLGVSGRWKLVVEDVGHVETPSMRREALEFLVRELA